MDFSLMGMCQTQSSIDSCCEVNSFQKYLNSSDDYRFSKGTDIRESTKLLSYKNSKCVRNNSFSKTSAEEDKNLEKVYQMTALDILKTCINYLSLIISGYLKSLARPTKIKENNREGYLPLYSSFENFYTQKIYMPIRYGLDNPVRGVPGAEVNILERVTEDYGLTFQMTGKARKCINMGSYNYLGFAQNHGTCAEAAISKLKICGTSVCSSRREFGNSSHLEELEELVARFVGTEEAITCAMGYATNALNLPIIMTKGCLVLSDEKNHASIITGLKLSGAKVRVFKHNDMQDLERLLREGVLNGQPNTGLPWEKMFIVVEGVYSMEGSIVPLPAILNLKRKFRAYVYLDEAHSIGAMGKRGRGVVDYWNADPKDVDILMGTFTKSFGSAGGYIAGSRKLIQMLREGSQAHCYGTAMSPPIAQQIISSMKIIMGDDGTDEGVKKIQQLAQNSKYFRQKLKQRRFIVCGEDDSPVVPVALLSLGNCITVFTEMYSMGVATVCIGYPATPLMEPKTRFCVSSAHTKEMLDQVVESLTIIGNRIQVCKSHSSINKGAIQYVYSKLDNNN